ncbi:hypothetical protein ACFOGJ_12410 [Marinibaculum pumilum]|uniref:Uncharacterized protein n=1 Tax=Marinibaculum pumilum TaxID=1766165 RepID=A0ABV7L095_9PROT
MAARRDAWTAMPRRILRLMAALLAAAALSLAPYGADSVRAAASYVSVELVFVNSTSHSLTVQGAYPTNGLWGQGQEPKVGTIYPPGSEGRFKVVSVTYDEGCGAYLLLGSPTGEEVVISVSLPFNGPFQQNVTSPGNAIQTTGLVVEPDPDNEHLQMRMELLDPQ